MPRDDLGVTQKDAVAERRFAPCLPRRTENISKVHGEAVQDSVVGKMQSPEPTFRVGEVHPSRHHYGVRHPIRRRRSSGTNPSEGKRFFFSSWFCLETLAVGVIFAKIFSLTEPVSKYL